MRLPHARLDVDSTSGGATINKSVVIAASKYTLPCKEVPLLSFVVMGNFV